MADAASVGTDAGSIRHGRGFTLIELLIVMGVIVFLLAAIGVVAMRVLGTAKISATKATVSKVQGLLQQRMDAVIGKDPDRVLVDGLVPRFGNRRLAEVMARKFTYRQAFPQTWAEISTYYPNLLTLSSETVPMTTTPRAESSEVLLFLLTRANVLGYPPEGIDVFTSAEKQDTDGNGKLELIDNWGNPLRFYRWPTRLVRGGAYVAGGFTPSATARALMPSLPTTTLDLIHDSDDKYGFLRVGSSNVALQSAEVAYFEQGGAPMSGVGSRFFGMGPFHTPETFTLPLIVSAGPDGSTGLYEPTDGLSASPTTLIVPATAPFGYLAAPNPADVNATYDNISNFSIRSGGK